VSISGDDYDLAQGVAYDRGFAAGIAERDSLRARINDLEREVLLVAASEDELTVEHDSRGHRIAALEGQLLAAQAEVQRLNGIVDEKGNRGEWSCGIEFQIRHKKMEAELIELRKLLATRTAP
jgi:hypothetical protein